MEEYESAIRERDTARQELAALREAMGPIMDDARRCLVFAEKYKWHPQAVIQVRAMGLQASNPSELTTAKLRAAVSAFDAADLSPGHTGTPEE